jgi:hypothetical protein
MRDFLTVILGVSFLSGVVLLLPYFSALRKFVLALKEERREVWEQLGSPIPFSGFSPRSASLVCDYLFRKKHAGLPGQLPMLGGRARALLIIELAIVAVMFAAAFSTMLLGAP